MEKPFIHHFVSAADWVAHNDGTHYSPPSLESEGFIHFSNHEQVAATYERHYADAEQLLLLSVMTDQIEAEVVYEDTSGNGEFPHVYGPLNLTAVMAVRRYGPGDPPPEI